MNNKRSRKVSPTFIIVILIFIGLLSYFCFSVATKTGLITFSNKTEKFKEESIDSIKLELVKKDSIIKTKEQEITKLQTDLLNKHDTVYIRQKLQSISIPKKNDSLAKPNITIQKSDSI